jgi:hypothetical protein
MEHCQWALPRNLLAAHILVQKQWCTMAIITKADIFLSSNQKIRVSRTSHVTLPRPASASILHPTGRCGRGGPSRTTVVRSGFIFGPKRTHKNTMLRLRHSCGRVFLWYGVALGGEVMCRRSKKKCPIADVSGLAHLLPQQKRKRCFLLGTFMKENRLFRCPLSVWNLFSPRHMAEFC